MDDAGPAGSSARRRWTASIALRVQKVKVYGREGTGEVAEKTEAGVRRCALDSQRSRVGGR